MPLKQRKTCLYLLLCLLAAVLISGCGSSEPEPDADGAITIGNRMQIKNSEKDLLFQEYKDALAPNGIYYATWVMGESRPYQNTEDETADLYDAQLYLLLEESGTEEKAAENMEDWINAAKSNYQVEKEEKISIQGQDYQWIAYRLSNGTSPYDRGVSVFATVEECAVCMEFTCLKEFQKDPGTILRQFLEGCSYLDD